MLPNMRSFISLVNRNIIHGGRSMEARRNFCSTPENSYGNVLSFHPSNSRAYVWCICIRREHQTKKNKTLICFCMCEYRDQFIKSTCWMLCNSRCRSGSGIWLRYGETFFLLKIFTSTESRINQLFFLCIKVLIYIPILDLTLRSGWKR